MIKLRILANLLVLAAFMLGMQSPLGAQGEGADAVPYTFKKGDTLNAFANRYLVNIEAAQTVQRYNSIKDATKIRPGTVIKVPTSLLRGTPIDAKIVAFSGNVNIVGKEGKALPAIGASVLEGQTLSTGAPGFITISIAGGSNVSIPSKSRVKIARLRKYLLTGGSDIELFVEQGRAETAAAPIKDANSRFRMRTPTAVSAVRGTVFRIGYDGPGSSSLTEVVEGAVAVDTGKSNAPALIPTGFGAALPISGKLLQEALLPAPQVANAGSIQADELVQFNLSPITGSSGYHTQVAHDAGFLEIFAETVSPNPVATFENVPDGSFFVRSMAIAGSGLEGLADTFGFRRRLTRIDLAEENNATSGAFRINWVSQGSAVTSYRFQLFDENDADLPMVDEPGIETTGISLTNLPPGMYHWRVGMRQTTAEGVVETWSLPQKFSIGN